MRKAYYWVPPCPRCDSSRTGRFLPAVPLCQFQQLVDACRNGELVKFYDDLQDETAFCADCGHEWNAKIETKWLTISERQDEREKRGIDELYADDVLKEAEDQENFISKKRYWR